MAGVQLVCNVLGRDLDTDEKELFQFMSPQGMAKINSDICKGVNLEQTLAEMRIVFECMKRRRQQIEDTLPDSALNVIGRMKRPPSTEEMVLLGDISPSVLLGKINDQLQSGEELEDIIEDLAVAHRQKQLLFDAQRLANAQGLAVSISRLAPTTRPLSGDVMSSNTASFRSNKIRVGLSPVVTWFGEQAKNQTSPPSAGPSPVSSPVGTHSPRSALKSSHGHRCSPISAGFPSEGSFNSVSVLDSSEEPEHDRPISMVSFCSQDLSDGGDTDSTSGTPRTRRCCRRKRADSCPVKHDVTDRKSVV